MKKRKKGFTLIELIVVIAILVILAALALPQYNNMKKESQRVVCNSNAEVLLRAYLVETALHSETGESVYKKVLAENPDAKCPLGHPYTFSFDTNGGATITCPEHGNQSADSVDVETGKNSAKVVNSYSGIIEELFNKSSAEIKKFFEENGFDYKNTTLNNSEILRYLHEKVYDGTWPEMSKDFYKDADLKSKDQQLYIRPYASNKDYSANGGKTIAFASTSNVANTNWNNTYMVYVDGTWYKKPDGKNFGIANETYDSLKTKIEKKEFVPVK